MNHTALKLAEAHAKIEAKKHETETEFLKKKLSSSTSYSFNKKEVQPKK